MVRMFGANALQNADAQGCDLTRYIGFVDFFPFSIRRAMISGSPHITRWKHCFGAQSIQRICDLG